MSARAGERAAVAAMVLATLLWGGTFVAIRDIVRVTSPQALVFGRFAVAALLFAFVALARRRLPDATSIRIGVGNGALMAGSFWLQALGMRWTSAGSSAFLTCASTLFAALFAWVLLRERPRVSLVAGIVLALAGSAIMSLDNSLRLGKGEMITLVGASLYAMQIVWIARHSDRLEPLSVVMVQCAVVALLLAPFVGDLRIPVAALDRAGWLRFGYLAVAGSCIAPTMQVLAQRRLSAGRIGLLFGLEPVFALVFALTLGRERFLTRWWIGAAMILGAIVMVEWRAANTAEPSSRGEPDN